MMLLLLHGLMIVDVPTLVMFVVVGLMVPGSLLAAWGLHVSRRKGGYALATQTAIVIAALALGGIVAQSADMTLLFIGMTVGLAVAAFFVHRIAPKAEAAEPAPSARSNRFAPNQRGALRDSLLGGAVFTVSTIVALAAIVVFAA